MVVVPSGVFQKEILDAIEKKTGQRPSIAKFQEMDIGDIERILEIKATPPIKIRRSDPSPLYRVRTMGEKAYIRAVVNRLLAEKN